MSPILKRDVGEQVRQAKRLAAAITGKSPPLETEHDYFSPPRDDINRSGNAYATSSTSRIGIGIGEDEDDPGPVRRSWEGRTFVSPGKGKERALEEDDEVEEESAMLGVQDDAHGAAGLGRVSSRGRSLRQWVRDEVLTMSPGRWIDLRNLLLEVRLMRLQVTQPPSLYANDIGNTRPAPQSHRDDLYWRAPRTFGSLDRLSAR